MSLITTVAAGLAATVLGGTMVGAPAATTTLTVDGRCKAQFGIGQWRDFDCTASATGGDGDYRYTWQPLIPITVFHADQGPSSSGYCTAYADTVVRVTVVSGAETASANIPFPCF
ncbi:MULTISPECIES: hypothetical protein [unclassified Micromonospora]|uniref:hypothetical protein n=1 Tax=unclassified Micromonospora TaxID=2617518 RepID=UPI00098D4470|nr:MULTISPECIES: hypothetical protein [unclassified Micromonospora]MDI5938655.1 hypothetical protein [Micromonospora sp. DH15]OON28064.1 hypothetical protein BSA16_29115 [Micromonospora sp. Rc5]